MFALPPVIYSTHQRKSEPSVRDMLFLKEVLCKNYTGGIVMGLDMWLLKKKDKLY
ncbi:hypothetical protein D922_01252 [Enterococcus faecalis 06-MB-DW-09]|nr:hypothetical protein D922_01252 [Enterococcus faecalis 06-MB-DW-09]